MEFLGILFILIFILGFIQLIGFVLKAGFFVLGIVLKVLFVLALLAVGLFFFPTLLTVGIFLLPFIDHCRSGNRNETGFLTSHDTPLRGNN